MIIFIYFCILLRFLVYSLISYKVLIQDYNSENDNLEEGITDYNVDEEHLDGPEDDDETFLNEINDRIQKLSNKQRISYSDKQEIKALRDTKRSIIVDKLEDKIEESDNIKEELEGKRKRAELDIEVVDKLVNELSLEESDNTKEESKNKRKKVESNSVIDKQDDSNSENLPKDNSQKDEMDTEFPSFLDDID